MTDILVRDDPRLAGRASRYSTWPHIREQSIGEHCWQVLRILLTIHPGASPELLRYTVFHDNGELTAGDPPYPVKVENPVFAEEHGRIEDEGLALQLYEWGITHIPRKSEMSASDLWIFKLAEFIEMWEWGLEEQLLGNQFAALVSQRCIEAFRDRVGQYLRQDKSMRNHDVLSVIDRAVDYVNRRSRTWPTGESK
jgi:hypothetical protein